jgi:hypothetical protein
MLIRRARGRRTLPAGAKGYLLRLRATDGYSEEFRTADIKVARAWAQEKLGVQVEFGWDYAISFDGISRLIFSAEAADGTLTRMGEDGLRLLWPPRPSRRAAPPSKDRAAIQELRETLQMAVEAYLKRVRWTQPEAKVRCAGTWHIAWAIDKDPVVWSLLKAMPEVREPRSRVWEYRDPNRLRWHEGKRVPDWGRFGKDITFAPDELPATFRRFANDEPQTTEGLEIARSYVYESHGGSLAFPYLGGRVTFSEGGEYNSSLSFSDDQRGRTSLMAGFRGDGAGVGVLVDSGLHANMRISYYPECE